MLRIDIMRDKAIVIITPDGKLEAADFNRLAAEVDPIIAANGKLNGVMVHAAAFPGWADLDAFRAHVRFIKARRRNIRRVAVVSDSALLRLAPAVARLVVAAEVRHFPFAEKARALAWLEENASEKTTPP
jgi:SpoIIAA-like